MVQSVNDAAFYHLGQASPAGFAELVFYDIGVTNF